MQIFKAIVQSYRQFDPENIINAVKVPGPEYIKVKYTSPNHQRYFYGLYAPPAVGSEILIAYEAETSEYYYLSTIVDHGESLGQISKDSFGNPANLYSEYKYVDPSGNPTAMFFKNHKDAGLKIQNYYAPGEPISNQVTLKSSSKHQLIMSDGPGANCVILQNADGDNITIGGDITLPYKPSLPYICRGITLNSLNTQQCIVSKGSFEVKITDGREITLQNDSKGTNALYVPNPAEVPAGNPALRYGNINLRTSYRDINIYTDNPVPGLDSNIFISTQTGVIQLNSGGDVKIFSLLGKITVQAGNGIDLHAITGDVNIEAKAGNVNIRSGLNSTVEAAGALNAYGLATTNLGAGTPLNLNSGVPTPITPLPGEVPRPNVYGK